MNTRFAISLALAMCLSTALVYAQPRSSSVLSESDKKAYVIMRDYIEWKQLPLELLKMCKKFDPSGAESREEAYASWANAHQNEFIQFDELVDKILPHLASASAATNLRPSEFYANYMSAKFLMNLEFTPPETKSKLCGSYANRLTALADPKLVEEGSAFLQDWIRVNSGRSAGK